MSDIPQTVRERIEAAVENNVIVLPTAENYAIFGYKLRDAEVQELKDLKDNSDKEICRLMLRTKELHEQLTAANKRIEELEAALEDIAEEKYPESVFTPLSKDEFNVIKHSCERLLLIPIDRLSAHYGRIFQKILSDVAKQALTPLRSSVK